MSSAVMSKTGPASEGEASFLREALAWAMDASPAAAARRHLGLVCFWLTLGLLSALVLRLELMTPALDAMQARTFGALLSLHGFMLFYFVALPVFPGVLGHWTLSRWAPDGRSAFPRLAPLSWHLLAAGGSLVALAFVLGGTEIGWSFDAGFGGRFDQAGTALSALGVLAAAASLTVMGINFLATLRGMRRAGFPGGASRLLAEALGCAAVVQVITGPLLGLMMLLVLADVVAGVSLFAPALGGDPRQFLLLFRLFNIPAQGLLLVAALGVALPVVASRCAAAPYSRRATQTLVLIAALGFGGWGAELMGALRGQPISVLGANPLNLVVLAALLFSLLFVVRFLAGGLRRVDTAVVYALAFFVTAAQGLGIGLLTAGPLGASPYANTQLAVAQMHLMMLAALGMALPAGLHAIWPTLMGREPSDGPGRFVALLVFAGTQLAFLPLLPPGLHGLSYRANAYPPEFQMWQVLSTAGSSILLVALLLAALNLVFSGRRVAAQADSGF